MLELLHAYGRASDQVINFDKSAILFSPNVRKKVMQNLLVTYHTTIVAFIEKYLGLTIMIDCAKNEAMN